MMASRCGESACSRFTNIHSPQAWDNHQITNDTKFCLEENTIDRFNG